MISFSQLNEQVYVDSILSESFLVEDSRSVDQQMAIDDNRNRGRKEVELARKEAEKVRLKVKKVEAQTKKIESLERRQLSRDAKELARIQADKSLSDKEREDAVRKHEVESAERKAKLEFDKQELEKEEKELTQKEQSFREKEKTQQEKIKAQRELQVKKLETQQQEAERKVQREIRRAERTFSDVFRGVATGTLDGVGAAVSYSIKALFSFVRQNPLASAGISTAIVFDQVIFNHPFFKTGFAKAIGLSSFSGGIIPNFIGFAVGKIGQFSSTVLSSAALTFISALATPIAILAVSGIGIYGAYRLIRILLDLGEAKALQIAKRLETASEDEMEEILRRELNVNTRKLKKQRA